jgi:nucleoside-diphosphate kinase
MAVQRTFSILKPDVTRRNLTGAVNQRIEAAGLRIIAQKRVHMTRAQAETFYGVHRERPFFGELVEMMTAAPVVVQVLEGENAIQRYRDVMGATNPEKAAAGTIRKDFAPTAPMRRRRRRKRSRNSSPATRSSDNKPEALVVRLARKGEEGFPVRLRQPRLTVRADLIHPGTKSCSR